MPSSLIQPSFHQGFARSRGESAHPELWDGLVGAWVPALGIQGDTLFDVSGNKNDGTLTNMDPATDWVSGQNGWMLDFDGGNDHVDCGNNSSLLMGTNDFSLEAWFNSSDSGSGGGAIVGKGSNFAGGKRYTIILNDGFCGVGFLMVQLDDGITEKQICSKFSGWNDGNDHQVYVVRDGTNLRMYTDGRENANSPTDITGLGSLDNTRPFTIASRFKEPTGSQNYFFQGRVGVVKIRRRVLSPSEILSEYRDTLQMFRIRDSIPLFAPAAGPATGYPAAYYDNYNLGQPVGIM